MTLKSALAVAAGAFAALGVAFAGPMAEQCAAQLKKEGRDPAGYCDCLEAKVQASPSLQQEFQALAQIADPAARYAAASDAAKAAMDSCKRT